ncbi:MAG: hypothetical protein R2828_07955 [Saprospiraceae bacterium]
MRILYLFLLILFTLNVSANGQDDFMVAFSVTGKIKYTKSKADKPKRMRSGEVLFADATITLKKKAKVSLYFDGEYQVLEAPGTYSIADVMKTVEGKIEDRFAEMVVDDFLMASTGGKGTGDGKSGIGYGNAKFPVVPIQPFNAGNTIGKVSDAEITFRWANKKSVDPSANTFKFTLLEKGGTAIHQAEVKGFNLTLSASTLGLKPGSVYIWQVEATSDEKVKSPEVQFEYSDASVPRTLLQALGKENLYQTSSAATQLFLEAGSLEEQGYYYAAHQRLEMAIKKYKKDGLLKKAYDSYLQRHDLMPEN